MTARRARLDAELVRRGLARSRAQAADLISAGQVVVAGQAAAKAATQVGLDAAITVRRAAQEPDYVSRGGHKLAGALAAFAEPPQRGISGSEPSERGLSESDRPELVPSGAASPQHGLVVRGRRCLDAGASTGGFTDVLLRAGADHVVAVDVGYGQLAWSLRSDPRVTAIDRVNIRNLQPEQVAPPPGLVTADLSFISLTTVLPALVSCARPDADFVLLVKPQFEVGKGLVGPGGVVRDPELRAGAVEAVARAASGLGLGVRGVTASPLPGPSGNVEYFLWLTRDAPPLDAGDLRCAIENGPQ
jgi:23S rRNA (cytidine1920-2'-O)/16S rRNA (cytidine1409-2'-O)-methyltransferase